MEPDLGDLGLSGVLHMYELLMPLRDQQKPVIEIQKEKGKAKGEGGFKDNKVVHDVDSRVNRHISHDRACTWI